MKTDDPALDLVEQQLGAIAPIEADEAATAGAPASRRRIIPEPAASDSEPESPASADGPALSDDHKAAADELFELIKRGRKAVDELEEMRRRNASTPASASIDDDQLHDRIRDELSSKVLPDLKSFLDQKLKDETVPELSRMLASHTHSGGAGASVAVPSAKPLSRTRKVILVAVLAAVGLVVFSLVENSSTLTGGGRQAMAVIFTLLAILGAYGFLRPALARSNRPVRQSVKDRLQARKDRKVLATVDAVAEARRREELRRAVSS